MADYLEEDDGFIVIFRPWITRNGQRIYHPEGKMWRLRIPRDKYRE